MAYPNFDNKQNQEAIFSPSDFIQYLKDVNRYPKFPVPKGVIFCYQKTLLDYVIQNHPTARMETTFGEVYLLDETNNQVAVVGKLGIGAPSVVTALEELSAWGVQRFISIGTAGTLQETLNIGDIVVCDRAIRDEGVSHHYVKPEKYSLASAAMVEKIKADLVQLDQKFIVGTSWTIDAPYRETIAEVRQYKEEGVLTVEMETAALFSVAEYRKVDIGAIFTISDSIANFRWNPQFHREETLGGLEVLYQTALSVLLQ